MGISNSKLSKIMSYEPGKAVPYEDVVFPSQLVIGVIDVRDALSTTCSMVSAMRHVTQKGVLRASVRQAGAVRANLPVYADQHDTSTSGQEKKLTEFISVIEKTRDCNLDGLEEDVKNLAAMAGCFILVMDPKFITAEFAREAVSKIKEITGRHPIVALRSLQLAIPDLSDVGIPQLTRSMYEKGVAKVYEIPFGDINLSETEMSQVLDLLHGCLSEGDIIQANKHFKGIFRNERLRCERAEKEATEAKRKMTEEIRQHERVEETLQQEMKKLKMKLQESSESRKSLVNDNARLEKELVREKEKRVKAELAMAENDKMAKNSQEMYKQKEAKLREELKTTEQHIKAQKAKHKEREETASREVEQIKKQKEEVRERSEKEKMSMTMLAEQLKKEVQSNKRRVNSLAKLVEERERDKATLEQQVNCLEMKIEEERARLDKEKQSVKSDLKNKLKSEKERVEQLERETWKLRTKIQMESEMRSEEKKIRAETPQWSFIPWMASRKQTQTGPALSEDYSRESSGESYMQVREDPAKDEFADILKQIADDLSDEAKIDSLGGQLGILQGDIERALKTNMRYEQITSRGTYLMLKQWRRGVSREDEWIALRRALEAAKLLDLADRYLPQEGSTASEHSKKAGDPHLLSGETDTVSEQGSQEESPKHSLDDEHYAPEDIMTSGGESEDAAEVNGTDQHRKLEDPHGQSGKDGPPLAQESSRGSSEVGTKATIDHSSPDDTSYMNEEENDGVNQQSEKSSKHSTSDVQDTTEDMPSGEMFSEETSTSNENQIKDITTKFGDLVSSLVFF